MAKSKNTSCVGARFICGGDICVHTIKEIDDFHVIHSYTYLDAKGRRNVVTDGFMYRSVFDKFVENGVIIIL